MPPVAADLGQYEYNALHWRTVKRSRTPGAGSLDEMRLMYYSANWQLVEERANVPDVTQLEVMVDAIPPVRGKRGAPRRRPDAVQTDRGYRSHRNRINMWIRGIEPIIPEYDAPHGSGLGVTRWVVERTIAWLHQHRRLRIRYERTGEIDQAFLSIGCILICFNKLKPLLC